MKRFRPKEQVFSETRVYNLDSKTIEENGTKPFPRQWILTIDNILGPLVATFSWDWIDGYYIGCVVILVN